MTGSSPLSGVMILDLTRVLAGPYCTMVLADLGARVIKVEIPDKGDDARAIGPFLKGADGTEKSAYFLSLNRGKESIALDLKTDQDREIFDTLLAKADILVENYRSGVMEKLGYGWEVLHKKYPGLIYAAASGFGHTGPYQNRAAYDVVVQAMGGMMSVTGHPDTPPTRVGTSIGDITAGIFTAIGITTALYDREKTGQGLKIDVAMLDCQIAILENAIARYQTSGISPEPLGARHPSIAPFSAFQTKDDSIVIAAGNDGLFATLADALGKPEIARDQRFLTNDLRCRNIAALTREIESLLAGRRAGEWLIILEKSGIPSGPINNVEQALNDPQIQARNMVVVADDPLVGPLKMAGNPIKLSGYEDPDTRKPAPDLDQDRVAILEELGLYSNTRST